MSSTNVCDTQDKFNMAFKEAVDEYPNLKEDELSLAEKNWYIVIWSFTIFLWVVLIFWAIILALRTKNNSIRPLNITVGAILSPIYIIAYYLSRIN